MIVQSTNDRISIRIQANDIETKRVYPLTVYVPAFPPETPLHEIRAILQELRLALEPLLEGVIVGINYSPAGEYFAEYEDEDLPKAPAKTTARLLIGAKLRRSVQRFTVPFVREGVVNELRDVLLRRFGGRPIRLRGIGDDEAVVLVRCETEYRR